MQSFAKIYLLLRFHKISISTLLWIVLYTSLSLTTYTHSLCLMSSRSDVAHSQEDWLVYTKAQFGYGRVTVIDGYGLKFEYIRTKVGSGFRDWVTGLLNLRNATKLQPYMISVSDRLEMAARV